MSNQEQYSDLSAAPSLTVAREAVRVLMKKLALSVKLIYVAPTTSLTDYYVVAYGRSSTHCRALADGLEDAMAASLLPVRHAEGRDGGDWILLDLGEVIVHIFGREAGEFYRFERLFKEDAFLPTDDILSALEGEAKEEESNT